MKADETLQQKYGVTVWETEDPVLMVWGTHNAAVAYCAATEYYQQVSELPDGLAVAIAEACSNGAGLWWADPAVLNIGDERAWPQELISKTPVKDWTPYMVVEW